MTRILATITATLLLLSAFGPGPAAATELPLKIVVATGEHARVEVPVSISLAEVTALPSLLRLWELRDGRKVPVATQQERGKPVHLWWIMTGETLANTQRTYLLEAGAPSAQTTPLMRVRESEDHLEMMRGKTRLLRYNTAATPLPPGADPKYKRSGYINPVWTASGQVVTDRAENYLHQLGVWLAYVGTQYEGRAPNFWDLLNGKATVQYAETQSKSSGPVFASFTVRQDHIDLGIPQQPKIALKETWQVRAWNVGMEQGYWIYDVQTTLRCAGSSPLTVKKHTWGGMAIRGAPQWYGDQCRFLTSEGKTRTQANHTRVRWCDISGSTNAIWSGLTALSHPGNLRHPEPVRVNEKIPYFCFVDSYLGDFTITPTEPLILRYRFYIHDDVVEASRAERIWRDFAEPPQTTVTEVTPTDL